MDITTTVENVLSKSQRTLIYHLEGVKDFCFKGSVPLDLRRASFSHAVRRCRGFRCALSTTNNDHHFPTLGNRGGPVFAFVIKTPCKMLDFSGLGVILIGKYFYTFAPFGAGEGKQILKIRVRNTYSNTHTHFLF